ncbi:hypothetical protein BDN67DRAFT_861125, partial [Paxillus ammoniavirescens]
RWERSHPTIEGRKIIIQRTIGSMTQYLTKAQGMPTEVEKTLTKTLKTFAWDNAGKPTINSGMMEATPAKGGKSLLNLTTRNEAIELTWLKGLLAPEKTRPQWAQFALALLATYKKPSPTVSEKARINPFLQSWETATRKIPGTLQRIIKVARKYNVKLATGALTVDARKELPIWFHIGANSKLAQLNNHFYAPCLRDAHGVLTVGHLVELTTTLPTEHRKRRLCICQKCADARDNLGCVKPFKCFQLAKDLLNCLPPRWNPEDAAPQLVQNPTLTQVEETRRALNKREKILFNPRIALSTPVENGFRVFSPMKEYLPNPACQEPPPPNALHEEVTVLTCGNHSVSRD